MKILDWIKLSFNTKKWIIIGGIGLICLIIGITPISYELVLLINNPIIYIILLLLGGLLVILSFKKGFNSVLKLLQSSDGNLNVDSVNRVLYKKKVLEKGPKIVAIGGGTGLSVLLRGLKEYTSNITAIVTVADDGGGSGVLREDLGMLPPGDIRNCILALADTEPVMEKVLQHRFKEGKLKGQNFGNLFIAAMNEIYGNFERAIKEISNVLAVTGRVLPMTLEDVKLYAKLKNGEIIEGESKIPIKNKELGSEIDEVFINPKESYPLKEAIDAINEADGIVLGPGSLYTSVIPNLLVKDLSYHIWKSDAVKIYVSNVMTQPGETDNYDVLDHVKALLKHGKIDIVDYVIVNNEEIPESVLKKYHEDGAQSVIISDNQEKELNKMNIKVIKEDLIDIKKNYVRHDAHKVSKIITDLIIKKKIEKDNKNSREN
ncbi:gluconeogenesis factor YvcK family protein [Thermohalobacter berrensis]|uniref:Putative gluconeogenesis factor n=1 Tax=Thermohalobacter berrensis TaxID=99594 RepID=A0A419SXY6_9FIRM|nr:YvcK family protein [Thermohalobacter berrensis]RKD30117.1 2-phospho-L-lactate transferase [Thermohalobacter berrensis]